ncbi:Asp/Glu/hydantoin racemase [Microbacterium terrae]|uniref:Asp/Glu/Hydantoin racemase n=1 Tax=Microbacterium terrae TaxID=69369 RepID=A0A0M2HH10_9MICO|nr:aspartate/glutamate racemase family protein [Microbacterium terrae]KJL44035.1 hypothetical protein RS81_00610 [Microbacterium terrae]MBP1079430.1 Asp/Glu/hydantoin racemase [Microbacterium terrae]GLJ98830.1 arylsulfatase [Microbacterium terrae]
MVLDTPRIAVISAVSAAIGPAASAIDANVTGVEVWNILDDRLLTDARAHGIRTEERERMGRLIDHAVRGGADGVLVTCSLYGSVVRSLAGHIDVPVLTADDAAFAEIAELDYSRIILVAPLAEALEDSTARLRASLPRHSALTIVGVIAEGAHTATSPLALAESIAAATAPVRDSADAIFLAQYSLAPAAEAVAELTGLPVITTPGSAARSLASLVAHERASA